VTIAAFASRVFDTTGWRGPQAAVKLHNDAGYEKAPTQRRLSEWLHLYDGRCRECETKDGLGR
jgi:hypothetical protein